jgi:hypothetical protein
MAAKTILQPFGCKDSYFLISSKLFDHDFKFFATKGNCFQSFLYLCNQVSPMHRKRWKLRQIP